MTDFSTPPHAVEAEQSVIGALLRDNDCIDRMGDLRAAHFYREDHRVIFSEVVRQITAGQPCDVISAGLALPAIQSCMAYLNEIAQATPSSANVGHYAELVRDRALRRALLGVTSDLSAMAFNPGTRTAGEVLDAAQASLFALAETRVKSEPIKASDAMIDHLRVMDDRVEKRYSGIPLGFAYLDKLLMNGPNRGALVILGARPSMGKTALALNIAENVSRDYSALYLSMEMPNGELLDRALAALGKIPLETILLGTMSPQQWDAFTAANAKLLAMNLHMDDQPGLTLLDVRSKARLVKRKHGLDLLVVDYLQLMSGDGDNRKNRNQQIEEISRGLKALAKELNIVVLALSQLSRAASGKSRPQLADLRDSGAIEQDADIVMFVHRDEVDNPASHMRGYGDLIIAKHRRGPLGDVLLRYEGMYTLFGDTNETRPSEPQQPRERKGLSKALY